MGYARLTLISPSAIPLAIMSSNSLPKTIAYVRITQHSWQLGKMVGDVAAADYQWSFEWNFSRGELLVQPSLGRALIFDPLGRFLERSDYQLEPGGDYQFTLRAKL